MLLTAKNITKSYEQVNILRGIDVTIPKNKIISITGPSGAGKSTLLHILGTLDKADKGELYLNGQEIASLNKKQLSKIRNQEIGFVFQFHNLLPEFSALENVMMPALFGEHDKKELKERAINLLDSLGLKKRIDHKPAQLSGGEQQRVAVARALINKPKIVFADEPSGNLDSENAAALHELFFKLSEQCSFVIVTHNETLAAMSHINLKLKDGKLEK